MRQLTKQEAELMLLQIKTSFPSFTLNEDVRNLWTTFLMDTDAEMAAQNLKDHIKGSKFAPTIHEVVKLNEDVLFERRKQFSIQQEKEDEERARLAVPPPWKRLGITQKEFEQKLIAEGMLGDGSE